VLLSLYCTLICTTCVPTQVRQYEGELGAQSMAMEMMAGERESAKVQMQVRRVPLNVLGPCLGPHALPVCTRET
jgi:hypothetical protein